MNAAPAVSVVVPTMLTRDIRPAVRSARGQGVPTEIVLVVDREPATVVVPDDVRASCDTVLFTGGGRGAAAARNLGVAAASADVVAFLDDDDEWLPGKLEHQLEALARSGSPDTTIIATRAYQRPSGGDPAPFVVPARVFDADRERVADYLFRRRSMSPTRPSIFLPTLLATKRLCLAVGWDEGLRRHQDWDFLLRAERQGFRVRQLEEASTVVTVGSVGSISASSDWETSLAWVQRHREDWSSATYVDYLFGQVLRFALAARSPRGVAAVLGQLRPGRLPSAPTLLLGLTGLVPRTVLQLVALRKRGRRRSTATG